MFQEFGSRAEDRYSKSSGGNESGERFSYTMVVIHHEDNWAVGVHDAKPALAGRVKEKMAPGPSRVAAHSRP